MTRGFSIRLFLADGTPDGLRVVEKSNWTGRAIVCPRSQFTEAKARAEFSKTGVYVLRGPSTTNDLSTIYIGEGDPTKPRLERHIVEKDFWTSLVLFTSKDENLNKAHVQYLEARLVELAKEVKRCVLDNGNVPQRPSLSEADAAEMETYLDEMLLIFPVLGTTAFERPQLPPAATLSLLSQAKGVNAKGYEAPQGFVVLQGSRATTDVADSMALPVRNLRETLISQGILVNDGQGLRLTQDYTFGSPSTAASVLLANSTNGRIAWKDESGRTLKDIQSAENAESGL